LNIRKSALNVANFISYPAFDYNNTLGTIALSANTGSTQEPINGNNLLIGTITFYPTALTSGTGINYDFTPGGRNDSNIVLAGTSGDPDPVDILSSVTNATIPIQQPTSPTPIQTPIPSPTSTPIPTPTTLPTTTATPSNNIALNKSVTSSSSVEGWGWYNVALVDGKRSSSTEPRGWSSINTFC